MSWKVVSLMLFATIVIFYAANIYDNGLSTLFGQAKWAALGALLVAVLVTVNASAPGRLSLQLTGPFLLLSFVAASIFISDDVKDSALTFASVGMAVVASRLLALQLDTVAAMRRFFDLLANIGRLVIVSAALMWLAGVSLGRGGDRFSAWVDNPNTLAIMLAPALVVFMAGLIERRRGWIFYHAAFFVVGLFLLLQTGSRASILWVAVSAVAFWVFRYGLTFWAVIGAALLVIVLGWWDDILPFVIETFSRAPTINAPRPPPVLSGREEVWRLGMMLVSDRPIFGYGLGSSASLITANSWVFERHQGLHFHNSYLTVWVEAGLLGLVALVSVIVLGLMRGFQHAKRLRRFNLPQWPLLALPWALTLGALTHAGFETWLLSAGNANSIIFWAGVWMLWDSGRLRIALPELRPRMSRGPTAPGWGPVHASPRRHPDLDTRAPSRPGG